MGIKHRLTLLRSLLLTVLGIFVSGGLLAQTVTGTVQSSNDNSPLVGATVLVKGTTTGTFTDDEGKFSVRAGGDAVLVVSYVGHDRMEVGVDGRSDVTIVLQANSTTLDEVVVTGYGTQKAKEVTSSITSVKAEDFNGGNVNDPSQLLQGKVAGLTISRPGGDPNGGFNIRLRGLSTIGQNTQPLFVIDGVIGGNINAIDPNDIQSIDVLKDGSAAAIYGTRGSSGVIIVTTKRGLPGRSTVDYNGYVALESIAKEVPVLSADEYRNFPGSSDLGSSTDWFDELTDDAVSHVHNLALSGGNGQTTYRFSLNLRDGQGVATGTGFEQLNGRLNLVQKALNDRLTVSLNLGATTRNSDFGFTDAFRYATIYNPTAPVRDESLTQYDGYFQQVLFDYYNPVAIVEQNVNQGTRKVINMNIRGEYEFFDGFKGSVFYSQQRQNDFNGQYFDKNSFWVGADRNGLATRQSDDSFNELFESTLNYNRDFGNVNLDVLAGYSYQEFLNEGLFAQGGDFLSDQFSFNNLSGALDFANGLGTVRTYKNTSKLVAFFGRVNLNFDDTYYLSATVRQEGSTKFGENNKWGTFPALSGGVVLSNLFDAGPFDLLKLRAGYGVTGSIPNDSYLSLQRVGVVRDGNGNPVNFFFNGEFVNAFGPSSNPNPDLQWETKAEINVGLDFSAFNNRLSGSIDWYNRNTTDLLLNFPVPVPPNLFPTTWVNIGELNSTGLEVALRYAVVENENFSWEPAITFSTFDVTLVSLSNEDLQFGDEQFLSNLGAPGLNGTPLVRVKEGESVGEIWGPVVDADNPVSEDGNWNILDLDGDGSNCDCLDDEQVLGNGLPDFELGINNSLTFGDFDLNFFFRGVFGHDLVNTFRAFYEVPSVINSYNVLEGAVDIQNLTDAPKFSSYHVEDASYLKLDNATLGYTVDLGGDSPLSRLRFYVAGQNLFFITNYSGVDPSVRFSDPNGGALVPGIDRRNTWFRTRTITVGANVSF